MSGNAAAKVEQLEKRIKNLSQDDNGPVFVLVIGVDAKSYCLIDGKEVYDGPEFEQARRRFEENLRGNRRTITVIDGAPARGVNEDLL